MAFSKIAFVLGFLFVLGWTQAAHSLARNPKFPVLDDDSIQNYNSTSFNTSDPVPSTDYRRDFNSTTSPQNIASPTPSDESFHTSSPNNINKKQNFTDARFNLTDDNVSTLANTETRYPYSTASPGVSGIHGTGTPTEKNYPSTPYTKRKRTIDPSYTGRYSTPEEDTAYPYTAYERDTARPTKYTGITGTARPRDYQTTGRGTYTPYYRTYNPTPTNSPFTWNTDPSPTPGDRISTLDPTGNCLIDDTRPPISPWEPRTTDYPWWWTKTPDPTFSRWWLTTQKTGIESKITGSDSIPGSLKNYFFIACRDCNVFSNISVKKDTRNAPKANEEIMFHNMIENMETKIDAALQNVMARIEALESFKPPEA